VRKPLERVDPFCYKKSPMKKPILVLMLIGLLILGASGLAEARGHLYISFGLTLGGAAVGAMGVYFFVSGQQEIGQAPPPVPSGLLNIGLNQVKWEVPEVVIRTTDSALAGPQGIEGYACLLRFRFR